MKARREISFVQLGQSFVKFSRNGCHNNVDARTQLSEKPGQVFVTAGFGKLRKLSLAEERNFPAGLLHAYKLNCYNLTNADSACKIKEAAKGMRIMILSCQNISKTFNDIHILKDVSFHMEDHDRTAIVGINGAGKTTLLRIIVGEQTADTGIVALTKGKTWGYLAQNQAVNSENTIYDELLSVKADIIALEQQILRIDQTGFPSRFPRQADGM